MISEAMETNTTLTGLYLDGDEMKTEIIKIQNAKDKNEIWTDDETGEEGARKIIEVLNSLLMP